MITNSITEKGMKMDKMKIEEMINRMVEAWKSEVIARQQVGEFTGGLITPKTQANLDSLGLGPERFSFGRNQGYDKRAYAKWFKNRILESQKKRTMA